MTAPHRTLLSVEYDSPERARIVERSVRPEIGAIDGDRTTATLHRDDETVEVRVAADDLVALRAGINTWLTLLSVAEESDRAATEQF
ncbi:KEOPS complex subunit Pcc1 [Haloarcula salina]|uniref:KEOPS complex Pcc1-like subunit n=1 Tax=Haloarcula salina TaxID=1429914 RepID=A0AA41KHB6_9EURY|nr:KEOPS complex subunit Pcc1 [Haloarcula salina]MBV0901586.1 KEOPS complex Pcc1-like subunit [Haloarcula salina]